MKLYFYGGAQSVTGSNYLLEHGGERVLVDCGLFQGSRYSEMLNYEPFPYPAKNIRAVCITHSHADHTGRLPKLYKEGFRGSIYASPPACDIIRVALPDTMHRIAEEARKDHHEPLFTPKHLRGTEALLRPVAYDSRVSLIPHLSATFRNAEHILGSSTIEFVAEEEKGRTRIVFTGDLGNSSSPLLRPMEYPSGVEYAVIESAYGSRIHESFGESIELLRSVIMTTVQRHGALMIPSFAIERTQLLLLELDKLFDQKRIPRVPVFVDSPLAEKVTRVYDKYVHRYFNNDAISSLQNNGGLFRFPWLTFTTTTAQSKAINEMPPPKIIIAGSGMSNGGRILHHEQRYLPDPASTILFVGYQAEGSLGREIFNLRKSAVASPVVRIFGEPVPVRCDIRAIGAFSAHADQKGLLEFLRYANRDNTLKSVFVVQGEIESASVLAQKVKEELGVEAFVPAPGQSFDLSHV